MPRCRRWATTTAANYHAGLRPSLARWFLLSLVEWVRVVPVAAAAAPQLRGRLGLSPRATRRLLTPEMGRRATWGCALRPVQVSGPGLGVTRGWRPISEGLTWPPALGSARPGPRWASSANRRDTDDATMGGHASGKLIWRTYRARFRGGRSRPRRRDGRGDHGGPPGSPARNLREQVPGDLT